MRDAGTDVHAGYAAAVAALPNRTLSSVKSYWNLLGKPKKRAKPTVASSTGRLAQLMAMIEAGFTDQTSFTSTPEGLTIQF